MRRLLILALLAAAACSNPFSADAPGDLRSLDPPASNSLYADWWKQIETCSGKSRDFHDVGWYLQWGVDQYERDGKMVWGHYESRGRIVMAQFRSGDSVLVRTLALHAILNTETPTAAFRSGACASLVYSDR